MEVLNSDMELAINELSSTEDDKKIIKDILYQERIRKELDWDNDAVRLYQSILDNEGGNND